MNDPDEARLPVVMWQCANEACGHVWEAWPERGRCPMCSHSWASAATHTPAILLAASAEDAEVLRLIMRDNMSECSEEEAGALERACIVSAADYHVLPRAKLDNLLSRCGTSEDCEAGQVADELRALIARETGKGEG